MFEKMDMLNLLKVAQAGLDTVRLCHALIILSRRESLLVAGQHIAAHGVVVPDTMPGAASTTRSAERGPPAPVLRSHRRDRVALMQATQRFPDVWPALIRAYHPGRPLMTWRNSMKLDELSKFDLEVHRKLTVGIGICAQDAVGNGICI